jgi:hypothetical protein
MDEQEATASLIRQAIAAPKGQAQLANAVKYLVAELERNRFNTERAIEIYAAALDSSVRTWVKGRLLGREMLKTYQRSGQKKQFAIELTEQFKTGTGVYPRVEDQRPPRRFLRFLLGA